MSDQKSVLVGQKAPDFCVPAVLANGDIVNEFRLLEHIREHYALIVFYPLDFTFVCPSELIAIDHRIQEFKERNVEVVAVSIDSHFTHNAWRTTPVNQGGIGPVNFVMAADVRHTVCQSYGVEHPEAGVAFRATFLLDKDGIVRVQHVNDLPIGREMNEYLRLVDALQFHEAHGEVCPAGWQKGEAGMSATTEGVASYLQQNSEKL